MTDNSEAWLDAADQMSRFVDTAAGFRTKALAAGFSAEAAEQIAVEMLRFILRPRETEKKK